MKKDELTDPLLSVVGKREFISPLMSKSMHMIEKLESTQKKEIKVSCNSITPTLLFLYIQIKSYNHTIQRAKYYSTLLIYITF